MKTLTSSLEHTGIPYVFAGKGQNPDPVVTVLGGVHGNEKAGIEVVKHLISRSHHHPIVNGTLQVAIGNIAAMKAGTRFVDFDLNRAFADGEGKLGYEISRICQLKPFLRKTNYLLDVHSTIKPSDPFIAIPDLQAFFRNKALVAKLGISTVIVGEGLWPENGEPIYADTFVQAQGGFGMTIEAGWIKDPATAQIIHGVNAALHFLGIFEGTYPQSPAEKELVVWHAQQNIVAVPGFRFVRGEKTYEWSNFEKVPAGTVYAEAQGRKFVAPEDRWIVFPKPNTSIVTGNEACILAKRL